MKVLNNRVIIKRGESFVLKFGNTELMHPLVLTKSFKHPFIMLGIKSMTYPQQDRYLIIHWLDCQKMIRFEEPEAMYLGNNDIENVVIPDDDNGPSDGIYKRLYYTITNGKANYFYCESVETSSKILKNYTCNFKVAFGTDETLKMVDNNYICDMRLIDGQTTKAALNSLCDKYNITVTDMGDMFRALQNIHAPELKCIDINAPLAALNINIPLYQFNIYVEV